MTAALRLAAGRTASLGLLIAAFTAGAIPASARQAVDPARVVPLVRGSQQIDAMSDAAKRQMVLQPLAGGALYGILAEDVGGVVRYLTPQQLTGLNWAAGEHDAKALANLVKLLPRVQINGSDGFYMVTAGGNYEASMLLLPQMWRTLNKKIKGRPVLAAPNKDLFFITGSDDADNLAALRALVRENYEKLPYPVSRELYTLGEGGISVFK